MCVTKKVVEKNLGDFSSVTASRQNVTRLFLVQQSYFFERCFGGDELSSHLNHIEVAGILLFPERFGSFVCGLCGSCTEVVRRFVQYTGKLRVQLPYNFHTTSIQPTT